MFRCRAATIVVAALSALTASSALGGPNLIRNPGFEEGPSPTYPGVGVYWETNDAEPHPDIDVLTTSTRHSGSYSQWLKANSAWDLGMVRQVSPYNSITPGKTYRVSAWIKTANVYNPNGWYVFGIRWMDDDAPGPVVMMPRQETLNYDWRQITWTVVAPVGVNRISVLLTRHTDGDAWYDDISVSEVSTEPPEISVSPGSLEHKTLRTQTVQDDVLFIQNAGGGTLNYSLVEDAGWLSCSPATGESDGEIDTITVDYDTAGLPVGHYHVNITVSDPAAVNPSVLVPVTLTVWTPGDFDYDGDVDQVDFGLFQACYSGSGMTQDAPACTDARLDYDPDVDELDFDLFLGCLSGPDVQADEGCTH